MPRKKDTDEWKPDGRGRYRRMVGWRMEDYKRVQQPFYLGIDLDQAKGRYLRVKELWSYLERKHQEPPDPLDLAGYDASTTGESTCGTGRPSGSPENWPQAGSRSSCRGPRECI